LNGLNVRLHGFARVRGRFDAGLVARHRACTRERAYISYLASRSIDDGTRYGVGVGDHGYHLSGKHSSGSRRVSGSRGALHACWRAAARWRGTALSRELAKPSRGLHRVPLPARDMPRPRRSACSASGAALTGSGCVCGRGFPRISITPLTPLSLSRAVYRFTGLFFGGASLREAVWFVSSAVSLVPLFSCYICFAALSHLVVPQLLTGGWFCCMTLFAWLAIHLRIDRRAGRLFRVVHTRRRRRGLAFSGRSCPNIGIATPPACAHRHVHGAPLRVRFGFPPPRRLVVGWTTALAFRKADRHRVILWRARNDDWRLRRWYALRHIVNVSPSLCGARAFSAPGTARALRGTVKGWQLVVFACEGRAGRRMRGKRRRSRYFLTGRTCISLQDFCLACMRKSNVGLLSVLVFSRAALVSIFPST